MARQEEEEEMEGRKEDLVFSNAMFYNMRVSV